MSEAQDTSQERTEEATPRKEEKAREEGQLVRSRELNTAAVVITGCAGLFITGTFMAEQMAVVFRDNFSVAPEDLLSETAMLVHLKAATWHSIKAMLPLLVFLLLAAFAAPLLLGGWNFSPSAMAFKVDRLSPLAGLKRMFSAHSLMELVKSLLKFSLLAFVTLLLLWKLRYPLLQLDDGDVVSAVSAATDLVIWAVLLLSMGLLLIAAVDVPFQLWEHSEKMKMTRQEVRDEMKEVEGKPEVKSRIRQLQREIAQRRMMAAVPQADVIITNPTHYSVALKYHMDNMGAPVVVAKGADLVALKIREIARAHQVEIVEAPPLARAIYHTTELEEEIPAGLYLAVAQVLAYVFQLKNYQTSGGQAPQKPEDIEIPPDYQFD